MTRAKIEKIDNESRLEMKTRFRLPFYFFASFLLVFFTFFTYNLIFGDNVTINGNSDPNLLERFGFVLVLLITFSIPIGIFIGLKTDFVKRIERELKLKNTTANKA
jgi:ABC-type polysaccharide/polyol phosphate export permease